MPADLIRYSHVVSNTKSGLRVTSNVTPPFSIEDLNQSAMMKGEVGLKNQTDVATSVNGRFSDFGEFSDPDGASRAGKWVIQLPVGDPNVNEIFNRLRDAITDGKLSSAKMTGRDDAGVHPMAIALKCSYL